MARVYRLPLSALLAWSAADMLTASWALGRARSEASYDAHALALYGANQTAVAFHEPAKLADSARTLEAHAPAWRDATPAASGSFDDFAAMATRMGAV